MKSSGADSRLKNLKGERQAGLLLYCKARRISSWVWLGKPELQKLAGSKCALMFLVYCA